MVRRSGGGDRSPWWGLAVVAASLVVVAGLIGVGWYRAGNHGWPWQRTQLAWCGLVYQQNSATEVSRAGMLADAGPVVPVFQTSAWGTREQVFAPSRGWTATQPSCPATLYRQLSNDAYISYQKPGGP